MELWQIRQENLRALLTSRFGGRPARLATAISRSDAYVWQLCYGKQARFGERIARHITDALNLPAGALDHPLRDPDPLPPVAQEPSAQYDTLIHDLLAAFAELTRSQKEEYLARIKADAAHNRELLNELLKKTPE